MNPATALRGALIIILLGATLGLAHNALSPDPVPWKPVPKTALSLEDLVPDEPGVAGGVTAREATNGSLDDERSPDDVEAAVDETRDNESGARNEDALEAERFERGGPLETGGGGERAEAETAAEPAIDGTASTDSPAETASGADYSDIPESQFPIEIPLAKAKEFYDRGGLLVLDARDLDEYEAGHIKNAQSAPFDDMVADVDWLERTAAYPHPVLVYCDGTDCELSLNLGFEISQTGHPRVLVLKDGYAAWADASYPTATGDRP